eukprot:gb/GECG01003757.1/.p1 GENE.gb/GECG01003757.1/~~gb/GECG01003757.1/.p1  ORF type:complete len:292 (+),score=22.94 gb/GECG01003757.1/:1-876(+)
MLSLLAKALRVRAHPCWYRACFSSATWHTDPDNVSQRKRIVHAYRLGRTPYEPVWRWQKDLLRKRVDATAPGKEHTHTFPDIIMFTEHNPVFTLGRGDKTGKNLKFDPECVPEPFQLFHTERGGQVTYHGPGQLTVYPVLNLSHFRKDLHWFVDTVENVVIKTLGEYGLTASRIKGLPGVWVDGSKVAQIGVNVNRWHTMHGFAINVNPDLSHFDYIVPCGIEDRSVCSMRSLLERDNQNTENLTVGNVQDTVMKVFQDEFGCKFVFKDTKEDNMEDSAESGISDINALQT